MRGLNEVRISRRNLLAGLGAIASSASFGYGAYRITGPEADRYNQAVAALPPLSLTESQIEEAQTLIAQGEKYLESLENPKMVDEMVVVDLQSPEFATAEAVVYEANVRKNEIDAIANNTGAESFLLLAGGAIGLITSAYSIKVDARQPKQK